MTQKTWCEHCKKELQPGYTGICPYCGEKGISHSVEAEVAIGMNIVGTSVRQRRRGFKRFIREIIYRWKLSGDPRLPKGVYEDIDIDRLADQGDGKWNQIVRDATPNGKVIHEEHTKLRDKGKKIQ